MDSFLYIHTNKDSYLSIWHEKRAEILQKLGYKVTLVDMTEYLEPLMFPYLNRLWKNKDSRLISLYNKLEPLLKSHNILLHFGGTLIHPDFLNKFNLIKIYHCADDPDASEILSRPVAQSYDICAISNPSVINMYKNWGCKNVYFWPLGGFYFGENISLMNFDKRKNKLCFVGSKYGVPKVRYLTHIPILKNLDILWNKKSFFKSLEKIYPDIKSFGPYWKNGYLPHKDVSNLYNNSKIGINLHNSLGPINARLYDLPAHGVLQICDNKDKLFQVFEPGKEIVGYNSLEEAEYLINYYLKEIDEAKEISYSGYIRYIKEYTQDNIMKKLINIINDFKK